MSAPHVHEIRDVPFRDLHELRRLVSGEHGERRRALAYGQSLLGAHVDVGPFRHAAAARRERHQRGRDLGLEELSAGARELAHDPARVVVGNDSRQLVGLGVYKPHRVRSGVGKELRPAADCRSDELRNRALRHHAHADLARWGVEADAETLAGRAEHLDHLRAGVGRLERP